MSQYCAGLSIEEMRERYLAEVDTLDEQELRARWGNDRPRFLGNGSADRREHWRPTSVHLGSPMYVDQLGREYTPHTLGRTNIWWVRIPKSAARSQRALAARGELMVEQITEFPRTGDSLKLHRHYKVGENELSSSATATPGQQHSIDVSVDELIQPLQASAQVVFEQEIAAQWTPRELDIMRRKAENREKKRLREMDRDDGGMGRGAAARASSGRSRPMASVASAIAAFPTLSSSLAGAQSALATSAVRPRAKRTRARSDEDEFFAMD